MSGYVYHVTEFVPMDETWTTRFLTTRKYEATKFLFNELGAGKSMSHFEVTRSRDGRADTSVFVDTYEFMKIDLGEA